MVWVEDTARNSRKACQLGPVRFGPYSIDKIGKNKTYKLATLPESSKPAPKSKVVYMERDAARESSTSKQPRKRVLSVSTVFVKSDGDSANKAL